MNSIKTNQGRKSHAIRKFSAFVEFLLCARQCAMHTETRKIMVLDPRILECVEENVQEITYN